MTSPFEDSLLATLVHQMTPTSPALLPGTLLRDAYIVQEKMAAGGMGVGQVASALEAAHRLGIVHRDLKPANVMLVDYEGLPDFVKVLDFGVSKIAGVEPGKGAVLGTPAYMAPEQAEGRGEDVDARTDQFSLAVLGYVLVTGLAPFEGQTTAEVLQRIILAEPTPLAGRVPWPSAEVERVLTRALSKRATERFARVTDFAEALAEAASRVGDAGARSAAPSEFQGRSLGNLYETVICLRPARFCDASNGSSGLEDVTIDALPLPINASMAEVA